MAGRDFTGQSDAQKVRKTSRPDAESEGWNASLVLGNTRRTPKAADEVAEKQNVSQKRGKIQTAWQDVISEAKMTPKSCISKASRERKRGRKCQPGIGENMQSTKSSR
jgi:hypothetical protein